MADYNSIHLGAKIDEFDGRITALENTTISHTTSLTNLNNDKISLSGGSTLGNLYIIDPSYDSVPSSNYYGKGFYISGSNIGSDDEVYFRDVYLTDGKKGCQFETRRSVNGSWIYHSLNLLIDNSGNRSVTVHDATAWLKGLGFPKILRGSCSLSNGQGSVTFSSAFNGAPTVVTVPVGTGTDDYSSHPGSVTAGGCKMFGTSQAGSGGVGQANYTVAYIAVGNWP